MHTNPMRRLPIRMLAGAAALLLLGACGDDKASDAVVPPVAPAITSAATPSETPSASATPSESASAGASAGPSESASAAAEGTVIEVNLVAGKPEPKLDLNQEFGRGDTVTVKITTDTAYEIHIHGYDYSLDAKPGETVTKTFVLDKTGVFVVEVEDTGKLLFNLVVR